MSEFQFFSQSSEIPPELCELWRRCVLSSVQSDPFSCGPAWQLAAHDALGGGGRLCIGRMDNAFSIFTESTVGEDVLISPPEFSWFSGSPLLGAGAEFLFRDFLDRIIHSFSRLPIIALSDIMPERKFMHIMSFLPSTGYHLHLHCEREQRVASLKGGLDGYLGRRSAKFRHNLRTEQRKAKEAGIVFERLCPATEEEADAAFERALAVESRSWKGLEGNGMNTDSMSKFYRFLLRRLVPQKAGRILFARHEGKDIGYLFGGIAGRIFRGQQFSYDNDWKAFSVGSLLQLQILQWICEDELERYDMGMSYTPAMAYKRHWAEEVLSYDTWLLLPPSVGIRTKRSC